MNADAQLTTVLRERGGRATPQRLVLHRVLRELNRHVTAEEVLAAAADRLPNLSLPTVYATLDLFEELGIVRRVSLSTDAALYDPRVEPHQHAHCSRCGRVEDIQSPFDQTATLKAARRAGFEADRAEVVVVGLCRECAARA